MSTRLDTATVPLDGLALVEASAGTGKTHAITDLYLRLVLEAGLPVERILVVTFTNAATAELRNRIRGGLRAVAAALEGRDVDDGRHAPLAGRLADPAAAAQRAALALQTLDLAAVHTIHGFCQRVLAEHAFEGGTGLRGEILADPGPELSRLVADFHRREAGRATPLYAASLVAHRVTPASLLGWVRGHLGRPYVEVLQPAAPPGDGAGEAAFEAAYRRARDAWARGAGEVAALLSTHPGLNRSRYRPASIEKWMAQVGAGLGPAIAHLDLPECVERLGAGALRAGTRKGARPPEHPFFDACETLAGAHAALLAACRDRTSRLRARLLAACEEELPRRLRPRRQLTYDDLVRDVHEALRGPRGEALAGALRGRFGAALVDEFQDTDPRQFAILSRLFGPGRAAFLVGDPKQAIYSFRGADVFAYLEARGAAERRYTLLANWRTGAPLVGAVNALFERPANPFVLEGIGFEPATAAPGDRGSLAVRGESLAALRFWVPRRPAGERVTRAAARAAAAGLVAGEVARLLGLAGRGRAEVDGRPLGGGDVAVLVRTHAHGRAVRAALAALGVGSVQHSDDNVFASPDAADLETLLAAVSEPAREGAVRAALATPILARGGRALWELAHDARRWDACLERFRQWHETWRARGFIRMFRRLAAEEGVAERLLAAPDGERRLTNVMHLADLLAAQQDRVYGMQGLVRWLAQRRLGGAPADEVSQLRLESDRDLVTVITVHRSKGLEFPVVFCPYAWDAAAPTRQPDSFAYHDAGDGNRLKLAIGAPPSTEAIERSRDEALAEDVRLLYVALTRARHHCTVVWGAVPGFEHGALAWLLQAPASGAGERAAVARAVADLDDEGLQDLLRRALRPAGAAAAVSAAPPATAAAAPVRDAAPAPAPARRFTGRIAAAGRATSFTALSTGHPPARGEAEADPPLPAAAAPAAAPAGLHALPRGARVGTCLHEILQEMDGERGAAPLADLAAGRLAAHGLESRWAPVLAAALPRVRATVLDAGSGLRLDALAPHRRLAEMPFHYPVAGLDAPGLRAVIAAHDPQAAACVPDFVPVHGWMKGFVDLVFEHDGRVGLLDYKSNWLGDDDDGYAPAALAAAMTREGYHLQYLLYVLAVHRWLRLRRPDYDYDLHFGDVYYLFLRGMDPAHGPARGIYRTRPPRALVDALDVHLDGGGPAP